MRILRFITFPFALLYGLITAIRNSLFDYGWLKSSEFDIPIIAVGNLSVGGTGKTPQIEYLIRLLEVEHRVAVLSRGYKRKTKGFVLAHKNATVEELGDEPFQYSQKFDKCIVAVDELRSRGISNLLKLAHPPTVILLDDAFQHRSVKAGLYLLLTSYNDLYSQDYMLPMGRLREWRSGAKRADMVVVTKCPSNLSIGEQHSLRSKLKIRGNQHLFFSSISYDPVVSGSGMALDELKAFEVLLITGIANPQPLLDFLSEMRINFTHLNYPDHYAFSVQDIQKINRSFKGLNSENKLILTTEKDFTRLHDKLKLQYLGMRIAFIGGEQEFDQTILNYVGKSTANR